MRAMILLCVVGGVAQAETLEARVRGLVQPAVDSGEVVGAVVGVVDEKGERHVFGFGKVGGKVPDGKTVFEIGSISKVFTSLLLADMVEKGQVGLADPIGKFLPGVKVPTVNGREITLEHLASHTSGLPRMPNNFAPKNAAKPYADYSGENMKAFLETVQIRREPGAQYDYSNYGAGLLGYLLTQIAKKDYDALLRERIAGPLGMKSTMVALDAATKARFADGHDEQGEVVPSWEFDALVGAGGIRSTVDDMLVFLRANIGWVDTPLAAAMVRQRQPRYDTREIPGAIGLGWCMRDIGKTVWHNGETAGFHSYAAFDPEKRIGVVILANSAGGAVDPIGYGLLRRLVGAPVAPLPERPKLVKLTAAQLDALVGVYDLAPTFSITVKRDGERLTGQATGQPAFRLFPLSPTRFQLRGVRAEIEFILDGATAKELILHQNGDQHAPKRKQ